jgi:hypothetical protein
MSEIYRTTIHGRILESRNLRHLLARAVIEKRAMDRKMRIFSNPQSGMVQSRGDQSSGNPSGANLEKVG